MLRRGRVYLALACLVPLAACFVENIAGRYCTSDGDCTEAGYSKCDTRVKTCVPATFDLDMGTGNGDLTMIGCTVSDTCPAAAPVCSPAQVCSSCGATGMSTECNAFHGAPAMPPTPFCGPSGGCVECLTKDNCDAAHKTCSPTNACVPCANNGECTSGVCTGGVCADKATLIYVNNATGAGCSDTGAGLFAMPFCTVQKGLNAGAMASKQVVVFGGTYVENVQATTTLNGGNDYVVAAVGVGGPIIKPAATGSVLAVLTVGGTAGKQVTVSFDGFTLDDSTLADGSFDIDCNGGGAAYGKTLVTLLRSTVKGASGVGVNSIGKCTLTFDADIFVGNKGGAISLNATDFTMTNLLVHNNGAGGAGGSPFGGIYLQSVGEAGKMTMFNLTVVNNSATATALGSGIVCAVAPTTLSNTLILGNQGPAIEISAGCTPSYSAFIGGSGSNNENIPVTGCTVADLLVDPTNGDFHPKKGGAVPCTLVNQGINTNAPDHDLDGSARPQPMSGTDDIGCYEAK